VHVVTTWLAAHALPPEFNDDRAGYIERVVIAGMNQGHAEGLIDAVDGFCEGIAFSVTEMARIFDHAGTLGLPFKLHAEQLSDLHGAAMAADHGALSADHLEYLGADGVAALAKAGTVAVLLPGAFYTLRETQYPPVQALRDAGVPIALATDCNPGTSPLTSLLLTMNMGATLFRLTPAECLRGVTVNAARALGLADRGIIAPGARADLAIWDVRHPAELTYRIGFNPLHARIFGGRNV
jgi:imidazolonepropionase